MKRAACWIVLGSLFVSPALSQSKPGMFDPRKPMEYIQVLADDAMEGRMSGLPGGEKAARYVAGLFEKWGLEPAGDGATYFQKFDIPDFFHVEPGTLVEIRSGSKAMKLAVDSGVFDDASVYRFSGSADAEAEIVFAGYGIRAPEKGYDDYAGIDVKGGIALVIDGCPAGLKKVDASTDAKIKTARGLGAVAILLSPAPSDYGEEEVHPVSCEAGKDARRPDFAVIGINQAALDFIFADLVTDQRYLVATIGRTLKPSSFATGVKARIKVEAVYAPKRETANVLARISGTDTKLKNEFIVFGAHMDHLGNTPAGEILNGANDNASGTAVIMEVARLMKESGIRPKRTLIFALWAAEEQGLLGSKHYVEHPLYPLDRTVIDINLDMVGHGRDAISVGGVYFSGAVWKVLEKGLPEAAMAGITTRRGLGGSDCLPFIQKGVPAFHIIGNEPHFKAHAPRDDLDLILPEQLERATRFVYHAGLVLAGTKEPVFSPSHRGLALFQYNETVNARAVPLGAALDSWKDTLNPDVDYQLVTAGTSKSGCPAADRESLARELAALRPALEKAPLISAFGVETTASQAYRTRGTTLILGLNDPSLIRDYPAWVGTVSRAGIKYVRIGASDLEVAGTSLSEKSREMIREIQGTGCLIIADGMEGPARDALLEAAAKPLLLTCAELPSGGTIEAVRKGNHVIGLKFRVEETPEGYCETLKKGRELLGINHLAFWNEGDMWDPGVRDACVRASDILFRAGWAESASAFNGRTDLSRILSGNFFELLRGRR